MINIENTINFINIFLNDNSIEVDMIKQQLIKNLSNNENKTFDILHNIINISLKISMNSQFIVNVAE